LKQERASLWLGRRKAAADSKTSAIFGTVARKENDYSTVFRAVAPSAEVRLVLLRKPSRFAILPPR
jgi:hypothetical protein